MKGLIIHDLNTKETVEQIIEKFKPKFIKPKNKRR